MVVHFIAGPAHGRTEAIEDSRSVIRIPEHKSFPSIVGIDSAGEYPTPGDVKYDVHEYCVTKRTPRYAIAEWEPPKVDVTFVVELEYDPYDPEVDHKLEKFLWERRTGEYGKVRVVSQERGYVGHTKITLTTKVDGPKDGVAISLAGEAVQHYLDAKLPAAVYRRVAVTAATN